MVRQGPVQAGRKTRCQQRACPYLPHHTPQLPACRVPPPFTTLPPMPIPARMIRRQCDDLPGQRPKTSWAEQDQRDRILDGAQSIMARYGRAAIRLNDFALGMRLAPATIRRAFPDMDYLLAEILYRHLRAIVAGPRQDPLRHAQPGPGPPRHLPGRHPQPRRADRGASPPHPGPPPPAARRSRTARGHAPLIGTPCGRPRQGGPGPAGLARAHPPRHRNRHGRSDRPQTPPNSPPTRKDGVRGPRPQRARHQAPRVRAPVARGRALASRPPAYPT